MEKSPKPVKPPGFPVKTFVLAGISILILTGIALSLDLELVLKALSEMRIAPLVAAILLASFASYFIGGYKWMRILKGLGYEVPFRYILFARLGSEPVKFVMPAKAGELVRPVYLRTKFDVKLPAGIGSLALDKQFNLFGLLIIAAFGLSLYYGKYYTVGLILAVAVLAVLVQSISRPVSRFFLGKNHKIWKAVGELWATLHTLTWSETIIQILLGTAFLFTEVLTGYLALYAAGVQVPVANAIIILSVVIFFVQIPITISGIGTRELALIALFSGYAPEETMLAVALAYTFVELIMPVLLGVPFMHPLLNRIKWKEIGNIIRDLKTNPNALENGISK